MRKIKCVTRTATSSAPVHRNRISLSRFKTVFINNARRPGQNRTVNTIVLCPIRDNGSKFPDGFALDFRLSAIRQKRVVPDRANWPWTIDSWSWTNFPNKFSGRLHRRFFTWSSRPRGNVRLRSSSEARKTRILSKTESGPETPEPAPLSFRQSDVWTRRVYNRSSVCWVKLLNTRRTCGDRPKTFLYVPTIASPHLPPTVLGRWVKCFCWAVLYIFFAVNTRRRHTTIVYSSNAARNWRTSRSPPLRGCQLRRTELG